MSTSSTSPDSFSPGSTTASIAGTASSPLADGMSANGSQYALPLAPYTFVMPSYHAQPAGGMPGINNSGACSSHIGNGHSGGGDGCGSDSAAFQLTFPFTAHESVRICLLSALNLAQALEDMPYPIPDPVSALPPPPAQQIASGGGGFDNMGLNMGLDLTSLELDFATTATSSTGGFIQASHASDTHHAPLQSYDQSLRSQTPFLLAPRTMPSFACCAMQCAYALLMVHRRTAAIYYGDSSGDGVNLATGSGGGVAEVTSGPGTGAGVGGPGGGGGIGQPLAGSLLVKLQQGLASVLASLENYALAYEALGGMRDQVRTAMEQIAAPRAFEF